VAERTKATVLKTVDWFAELTTERASKSRVDSLRYRFGVEATLARSSIRGSWHEVFVEASLEVNARCVDQLSRRQALRHGFSRPSSQVTCGSTELSLDDLDPELTQLARVGAA
jgi:hypothetical protein